MPWPCLSAVHFVSPDASYQSPCEAAVLNLFAFARVLFLAIVIGHGYPSLQHTQPILETRMAAKCPMKSPPRLLGHPVDLLTIFLPLSAQRIHVSRSQTLDIQPTYVLVHVMSLTTTPALSLGTLLWKKNEDRGARACVGQVRRCLRFACTVVPVPRSRMSRYGRGVGAREP